MTCTLPTNLYDIKTSSWIPRHTHSEQVEFIRQLFPLRKLCSQTNLTPQLHKTSLMEIVETVTCTSAPAQTPFPTKKKLSTNCCSCRELQFPKYANKSKHFWRRQSSSSPISWCLVCEYYRKSILQTCYYTNKFIISRTVMVWFGFVRIFHEVDYVIGKSLMCGAAPWYMQWNPQQFHECD